MPGRLSARALGRRAERQVRLYYRLRGYRVLEANARTGRNELDIVLRETQPRLARLVLFPAGA